jgi:protein-tyrosine phosphatase
MKQVLFLCSGNYYRSRFAEHLFNWLAAKSDLPWRADSRGLQAGQVGNIGPISRFAVDGLKVRGIPINGEDRYPIQLSLPDLAGSDLVIAVKEDEHRVMLRAKFPSWEDRIEYWHIHDLDCALAEEALPALEEHVRELIDRLRALESAAA